MGRTLRWNFNSIKSDRREYRCRTVPTGTGSAKSNRFLSEKSRTGAPRISARFKRHYPLKSKEPRIPLPPLESLDKLPPAAKKRSARIAWSRVSLGYQPLLTQAWFECMSMFDEESKLDQVFANTYFWVITRSNECYY